MNKTLDSIVSEFFLKMLLEQLRFTEILNSDDNKWKPFDVTEIFLSILIIDEDTYPFILFNRTIVVD
jgi:hypothetical protein